MLLPAVIDRLRAACPSLKLVDAIDEVATDAPPAQAPAAFVLSVRDRADPNRIASGSHRQRLEETFGVLLVVRNPGGKGQATLELEALKDEVRTALMGWLPGDAWTAAGYRDGSLVDALPGGVLWWLQTYGTTRHLVTR